MRCRELQLICGMRSVRIFVGLIAVATASAQPVYPQGAPARVSDLPPGQLRSEMEALLPAARDRALRWLGSFPFPAADVHALHVDADGGICYACSAPLPSGETMPAPAVTDPAAAAVPVDPLAAHLILHSRQGSANVLYLDFTGEDVSGTEWNNVVGRTLIPARAFTTDADATTFSDAEQLAIRRIWQRMAEDYAPFDIDVTTERPAFFNNRTAHAVITSRNDANGAANPYSSAGGVAYVNVFGTSTFPQYRPAWVYHDNLSNNESYIAEAASHEIGHNLGLSHDGRTDGSEYYGGHGSGDQSWGPLMGTGYNRNVSQWSKGEYYLANNTQDDLATIAGKLTYRTDDHGNTSGTATPLVLTGGTNVFASTPETDPARTNTANKGVLERNTDVDVFSFVSGSGTVRLSALPWLSPSGTRGGNTDLQIDLYNEAGALLDSQNPATLTTASIETNLTEGLYYLHIRNSAAGDPLSASPTGYTIYGGIGQYFITGSIPEALTFVSPPVAEFVVTNLTEAGRTNLRFQVNYSDNVAIQVSSLGDGDVRVSGTGGYNRIARFIAVDVATDGSPRRATYEMLPPTGAVWESSMNGVYEVRVQTGQVADTEGAFAAAGVIGSIEIAVPVPLYVANMDTNPGWALEPEWQYGVPAYGAPGPTGGYTGVRILAYNLAGSYGNNLPPTYATTPPINTAGSSSLQVRYKRWLRVRPQDAVSVEVSTNAKTWISIWSSTGNIGDSGWNTLQHLIPSSMAGSTNLRIRFSQSSNQSQSDLGWNLDDVEILGDGALDTDAPTAELSVADLKAGGSPSHACSVTYHDRTGVRLSSLDSADLRLIGPGGYSNLATFVGADLPADGTTIQGAYNLPAPGGIWDAADNGLYELQLVEGAVEDTVNNSTTGRVLGVFSVLITEPVSYRLTVSVSDALRGEVDPTGGLYTAFSAVSVTATPSNAVRFIGWSGDLTSAVNPLIVTMDRDWTLRADFIAETTTNYPTPLWWLAQYGFTNDPEAEVSFEGANGYPVWQSYLAGLVPTNPASQLRMSVQPVPEGGGQQIFVWEPTSGRVYTISAANALPGPFDPLPGAIRLPATVRALTNELSPGFYRLGVDWP